MRERAQERKAKGYLQYFNTNETELRFKDYYETDYGEEVLQLEEEMDY